MRCPEELTFGEVAELYDRVRPAYPDDVYTAVMSAVGNARRALEAGAGTGHATAVIAGRGIAVDAVEADRRMADVAQARCKGEVKRAGRSAPFLKARALHSHRHADGSTTQRVRHLGAARFLSRQRREGVGASATLAR